MVIRLSSVFVATALVLGTFAACSSTTTGGGSPSAEAGFCDVLSSTYAKCGAGASSCSSAITADCTKLAGIVSPSVLDAAKSCVQSTPCGSDPLACLGRALGDVTATDAQTKLANDYCDSCSVVGGSPCKTAFFGTSDVPGLGFALLPFGDGPLGAIDDACTTNSLGKTACQTAFSTCLSATTTKFLATNISTDSAACLISGIKDGLSNIGSGSSGDGGKSDACKDCAGCCQDGVCQTGTSKSACGTGGGSCESCQGSATCTGGACSTTCGPDNCAGCCNASGVCITTDSNSACGKSGEACTTCAGTKTCDDGQCIETSCKATCASGCCSAAGCQAGNTAAACGTGGDACSACGGGQTCSNRVCTLSGSASFDFVAVGAHVPTLNQSGGSWDAFSGLPDPYVTATSGAVTNSTSSASDTLAPVWNAPLLTGLTAAALKANLKLEVYDADVAFNDLMGGCNVTLTDAAFDGALHTATCAKSDTGVALTVDYRLTAH